MIPLGTVILAWPGTHTTDYFLSSISYKLFKSHFIWHQMHTLKYCMSRNLSAWTMYTLWLCHHWQKFSWIGIMGYLTWLVRVVGCHSYTGRIITEGLYDLVKKTPQAITSPSPNLNTTARDACKLKEPCIYHLLKSQYWQKKPGSRILMSGK